VASEVREGIVGLEEQLRHFQRASNRLLIVETGIELLDKEEVWRRLQDQPPFKGSENAGSTIPHPDDWDSSWTSRIESMTTEDLLTIYRQWLQRCSFLLTKADVMGPGSPEDNQFQILYDWHSCFSQRVFTLAPSAWANRHLYDIETLQLSEEYASQERNQVIQYVSIKVLPQEIRENIAQAYEYYHAESSKLQRRHMKVLAAMNNAALSFSSRHADRMYSWSTQDCGLWDLIETLAAVLRQQKMALRRFEYVMHRIVPASVAVRLYVLLYPQCSLTMVDLAERVHLAHKFEKQIHERR
jgi:hypothetical protein